MKPAPAPAVPTQKLHKVLAQAGLGSRRDMEQWIRAGRVTVNGRTADIGTRVAPHDRIRVGRREIRVAAAGPRPRVLLYHKPEGEVTTRDDPQRRATVFDKLPPLRGAKWIAIGRLDYNSCGLLMFTTSGELANRMMHPRFELEREYAVRVLGQLTPEHMRKLMEGVRLDDGFAKCESAELRGGEGANQWCHVVLKEGRNREVRRMFEALGLKISRLMRVRFGPVSLPPRLRRGQLMELDAGEVARLLAGSDAASPAPPAPADRGAQE
ncbi:MAG TPA: pseudouridine synthase [Burkholderiales bacterium]|nr:pseudouridine synthase [Burkholderiales bacterium]